MERPRTMVSWSAVTAAAAAIVITAFAVQARRGPLGPESIWFDDAWVAAIGRLGWRDVPEVGLTSPGFVGLEWIIFRILGFGETRAQLLPFLAGALSPALLMIGGVWRQIPLPLSVGAGLWLAWAPAHVDYSTRVKQYTLDGLFALLVLGAAWGVMDHPRSRARWALLGGVAIAASAVSMSTVPVVAAGLGAAGLASLRHGRTAIGAAAVTGLIYTVALAIWWKLVIEPATQEGLWAYWSGFYTAPSEGIGGWASVVWARLRDLVGWMSPFGMTPTMAAIGLAIAVLAWRRPLVAVLAGGPLVIAVVLSSLAIVPLGTGRTDIYLYPSIIIAVAAGFGVIWEMAAPILERRFDEPAARELPAILLATVAVVLVAIMVRDDRRATPYPVEGIKSMVAQMEASRSPDEPVLVYPSARYGYAIYTSSPVALSHPSRHLVFSPYSVDIGDPLLTILEPHRNDPQNYRPQMEAVAGDAPDVWFLASHQSPLDLPVILEHLEAMGFRQVESYAEIGAELSRWTRSASSTG